MIYRFEQFELDTQRYEIRSKGEPVQVEPQVFDVLEFLIRNRDRVVTKQDLFDGVWGDRIVSESALSSRLKAARTAVCDSGSEQRLIKTLHGRGYRFVGEVTELVSDSKVLEISAEAPAGSSTFSVEIETGAVGRELEVGVLLEHLALARNGFRQLVFVTGEAGLGKTTLVETFLATLGQEGSIRVLKGQCLEHHGRGEAFLPVLEALGRVCRQESSGEVVELLRRKAPSWLIEMPWLVETEELVELRQVSMGMTRDRMLREIVEVLEDLTSETPGVLVLEDLHWSDPSTVDLLTYLANRDELARLLVIGTYRAADARAGEHPVDRIVERLEIRNLASKLPLSLLTEDSIRLYLENRLAKIELPDRLPALLRQRTDGNPLFMGAVVDQWIAESKVSPSDEGWRVQSDLEELSVGVPESLRLLIERRLSVLPSEDLSILETASVVGAEFPTTAVAAGIEISEDEIEERCSKLARAGTLLHECEPVRWPDGTVSACFRFVHDVFHEVLYSRVPAGRRARLHDRVANRLEGGFASEARNHGAELASHFIEAQNPAKAVEYLLLAAHQALRRFAQIEGIRHLRTGLRLLAELPEDSARHEIELSYQAALAPALIAREGFSSQESECAFLRARELAELLGDRSQQLAMIYGLAIQKELSGNFLQSQQLMEERLRLQESYRDVESMDVENHDLLACSHFHQGGFVESLKIAEAGMQAFDSEQHSTIASRYGENPGIACFSWAGLNLWYLGSPDRAIELARQAVELAADPAQLYHLANAKMQLALQYQMRQDIDQTIHWAQETIDQSKKQGFVIPVAEGRLLQGWAMVKRGDEAGFELLQDGLDVLESLGARMDRPYFLGLMADSLGTAKRFDDALEIVDEALGLIDPTRSHFYQSELFRLRGQLLLALDSSRTDEAEESLQKALDLTRQQRTATIEVRVATDLAALWADQGREDDAQALLTGAMESFEGASGFADLERAKAVLQSVAS